MTKRVKHHRKLRTRKQVCLAALLVSACCAGVLGDTRDGYTEVVGASLIPNASKPNREQGLPKIRLNPFIVDEDDAPAEKHLIQPPSSKPSQNRRPLQTDPAVPDFGATGSTGTPNPTDSAPAETQMPVSEPSVSEPFVSEPFVSEPFVSESSVFETPAFESSPAAPTPTPAASGQIANNGLRKFPARLPTVPVVLAVPAQLPTRLPIVANRPDDQVSVAKATRLPLVRQPGPIYGRPLPSRFTQFQPVLPQRPTASMVSQSSELFELAAPANHPQPYGASDAVARLATGGDPQQPSSPSDLLLPAPTKLTQNEDLLAPIDNQPTAPTPPKSLGVDPLLQPNPDQAVRSAPAEPAQVPRQPSSQQPQLLQRSQSADQALTYGGTQQQIEHIPAPAPNQRITPVPASSPVSTLRDHPPVAGPTEFAYQSDFSPTPVPLQPTDYDASREQWIYDEKHDVPTQRPLIELGRLWYSDGITPPGINLFGETNMVRPKFWVYGDYRLGVISGKNAGGRTDNAATQLNLDFDFWVTDSERFHMFVQPFNEGAQVSNVDFSGDELDFNGFFDITPVTGFFEGDLGAMIGGIRGTESPMEIPVTIGLVPLLFQNGIWMEDAVTGAAFSLAGRNSRTLKWSNFDATFFAAIDQINSPAFAGDEHAAQVFGTAWFIEAYNGYIETGYAYLNDRNNPERSYHNSTFSYTARYLHRFSSSLRVIVNSGQDLPKNQRTADGALVLFENSLITAAPLTFVPYYNFFAGFGSPQSVARAGASGGILRNVGLNFDTDGINGLANLNATGTDSFGGAIGVDLIGKDLDRQLVVEAACISPQGSGNAALPDEQYGLGARYQFPISNGTLLRFDTMYGWRRGLDDVYGTRFEYRWKF